MAKNGIQCQVDLNEGYIDLVKGIILDLSMDPAAEEKKIENVHCKTTRITVLKWDEQKNPTCFKVDWTFFGLAPDKKKILDEYIDRISVNH